ncbi:MAG: hypothetical protein KF718_10035 [Polyangiaceae bacterium]|nr:hypothetical protein [Polyangiaceae bacterium]
MHLSKVEGVSAISDRSEVSFSDPSAVSGYDIRDGSRARGEVENAAHFCLAVLLQEVDDELDDLDGSRLKVRPHSMGGIGTRLGVLAVDATPRQAGFIGERRLTTTIEKAANEAPPLHLIDNVPDEPKGLLPAIRSEGSGVGGPHLNWQEGDHRTGTGVVRACPVDPPEQPHLDLADALHAVHRHVDRQDGGSDSRGQRAHP